MIGFPNQFTSDVVVDSTIENRPCSIATNFNHYFPKFVSRTQTEALSVSNNMETTSKDLAPPVPLVSTVEDMPFSKKQKTTPTSADPNSFDAVDLADECLTVRVRQGRGRPKARLPSTSRPFVIAPTRPVAGPSTLPKAQPKYNFTKVQSEPNPKKRKRSWINPPPHFSDDIVKIVQQAYCLA